MKTTDCNPGLTWHSVLTGFLCRRHILLAQTPDMREPGTAPGLAPGLNLTFGCVGLTALCGRCNYNAPFMYLEHLEILWLQPSLRPVQ
jgi:hypothetical protein